MPAVDIGAIEFSLAEFEYESSFMAMTSSAGGSARPAEIRMDYQSRQFEIARRHAVDVLIFIYLIIVLDGLVRKYILPDYQRELIVLRDPVVLYLYIHSLRYGLIQRSGFLIAGIVIATLTVLVIGFQLTSTAIPGFLMVFGFRMYYSLLLLPFIIAVVFTHDDMQRFFRLNLILIVCMAPMLVLQVLSPKDSWINVGGAFDEDLRFSNLTYGFFVRPSGFFTSAAGASPFLTLVGAIVLLIVLMPKQERPCSQRMLLASTAGLMVSVAVCGSRSAIMGLLVVIIGALLLRFILPVGYRVANRAIVGALGTAVAGFVVSLVFFPENFEAIADRWSGANAYIGPLAIVFRALYYFVDFLDIVEHVPPEGVGLGAGTNAAVTYYVTASLLFQAESGWARHIVDLGPFLGIVFIGWRIWFSAHLLLVSLRVAHRFGDPRPWLLLAALGYTILNGQTSGNSTLAGLAWFTAGLILAAPNYARPFR